MLLSMGASSLLLRTEKDNEIKVHIVIAITLYEERRMPEGQSRCHGPLNFLDNDITFEGKKKPWEKGSEPVNKFANGYRPKKKRESSRVKSEELSRKRKHFPTEACSIRRVENLPPSFIPNKYIHG